MKLIKFKLIENGYGGIEITGTEYSLTKGGIVIPDDVTRTRKIGLGVSFQGQVAKLKYYFLNLTGHWIEPFNKYYDRNTHTRLPLPAEGAVPMGQQLLIELFNKVDITGVTTTDDSFVLTGTYNSYGNKKIGISTRTVTEDDDAGFFNEAMGTIREVFFLVTTYFKENMLPATVNPEQYLSQFSDANKEEFVGLSKDELVNRAIDELQKRGAIILMPEGGGGDIEVDHREIDNDVKAVGDKATLDTRTGNIDGKNLEEVSHIDAEKDVVGTTKKSSGKKAKTADNDREFPPDNITDEDIQEATGTVITEEVIPAEQAPKVQKKKAGSTLASEKDFAAAVGEEVRDDTPVDLTAAEFSQSREGGNEVDDWNASEAAGADISDINFEDSVQNPD